MKSRAWYHNSNVVQGPLNIAPLILVDDTGIGPFWKSLIDVWYSKHTRLSLKLTEQRSHPYLEVEVCIAVM